MKTMKRWTGRYPMTTSLLLTIAAYVLVIGTLYLDVLNPLYPSLSRSSVNVLSHVIAGINSLTIVLLGLGWFWIRRGHVDKHPVCMMAAFMLIMVFLVLYLIKTGGGGRKEFVGPFLPRMIYFVMLAVHILLSIVSVPLVLYTLILGGTRSIDRVPASPHAAVGRFAAGAWMISLVLGIAAYVLLNHVYSFQFVQAP